MNLQWFHQNPLHSQRKRKPAEVWAEEQLGQCLHFNILTKKFYITYKYSFHVSSAPVSCWNATRCAAKKEQFKFSWQCFLNRALFSTRRTFQIHPDLTGGSSEGFEVAWQKKRQPILRTKLRLLQGVASFVTIRTPFPMNLDFVLFK